MANRSGRVFSILFNIVDDVCSIGKYNWGGMVYEYLVGSTCEAKMLMRDKPGSKNFQVMGLVLVESFFEFLAGYFRCCFLCR